MVHRFPPDAWALTSTMVSLSAEANASRSPRGDTAARETLSGEEAEGLGAEMSQMHDL